MGILDNEDEYYMQQALREARMAADEDEVPIGAVVVMGGDVIARAHNQTERLGDATVYGAADPKRGYKLLSGQLLHPKTEVTGGVLADECGALVKEFFRKKR